MGGMAAQIPIKNDPAANEAALAKVLADKEREAGDGHDGTWVAHPGLVPVALQAFDRHMPQANQISRQRGDVDVTAAELLSVPTGTITESRSLARWQRLRAALPFDGGRGHGGNLALPNLAMAEARRDAGRWSPSNSSALP